MSQQQKYAKQKQERDDNTKPVDGNASDVVVDGDAENCEDLQLEPTTKIKIHRKRSIQQTTNLQNSSDALQETNLSNKNASQEVVTETSVKEKKCGKPPDLDAKNTKCENDYRAGLSQLNFSGVFSLLIAVILGGI